ncbi:hypothetical protein HAX54_035864, partial [Datura stramonium]|nr:hypothetical protein [Datura stramonium]
PGLPSRLDVIHAHSAPRVTDVFSRAHPHPCQAYPCQGGRPTNSGDSTPWATSACSNTLITESSSYMAGSLVALYTSNTSTLSCARI